MKLEPRSKWPKVYLSGIGPILTKDRKLLPKSIKNLTPKGKNPIVYLSGRFGSSAEIEADWIRRSGCKYRCFSYAYVCPDAFYFRPEFGAAYEMSVKMKQRIAMDSSAYSFHKFISSSTGGSISGKNKMANVEAYRDKTIKQYIEFCHKYEKVWDFYFTFDYIKHCPTIYKMTSMLQKEGLEPVPVFHGDESLDWLRRYIDDGHKIVGIGSDSSKRRAWKSMKYYYDQIFNITEKHGVYCHGLAVTSLSLGFDYPWYSLDSSTWARISGFGKILFVSPETRIIGQLHVSDREAKNSHGSYNRMPNAVRKEIRAQVERHGFDFDLIRKSLVERSVYNGWIFAHMSQLDLRKGEDKAQWERLL